MVEGASTVQSNTALGLSVYVLVNCPVCSLPSSDKCWNCFQLFSATLKGIKGKQKKKRKKKKLEPKIISLSGNKIKRYTCRCTIMSPEMEMKE